MCGGGGEGGKKKSTPLPWIFFWETPLSPPPVVPSWTHPTVNPMIPAVWDKFCRQPQYSCSLGPILSSTPLFPAVWSRFCGEPPNSCSLEPILWSTAKFQQSGSDSVVNTNIPAVWNRFCGEFRLLCSLLGYLPSLYLRVHHTGGSSPTPFLPSFLSAPASLLRLTFFGPPP